MQKSSKIESVVCFVVGNLWCIKMFGENSFASWVTRKIVCNVLGWLVWIPTHLVFICCVMTLKKRFEKIRFENPSFLAYEIFISCVMILKKRFEKLSLKIQASLLSKTQLTSLLWIVLKLVRLVWIFEVMRLPQSNIF